MRWNALILEDFDYALGREELVEHLRVGPQLAEFGNVNRRQLCGHFAGTLHSSAVRMQANETEAARVDCPRHKQTNKQTALSMGS